MPKKLFRRHILAERFNYLIKNCTWAESQYFCIQISPMKLNCYVDNYHIYHYLRFPVIVPTSNEVIFNTTYSSGNYWKTDGWSWLISLCKYFAGSNVGKAFILADSSSWLALIWFKLFRPMFSFVKIASAIDEKFKFIRLVTDDFWDNAKLFLTCTIGKNRNQQFGIICS